MVSPSTWAVEAWAVGELLHQGVPLGRGGGNDGLAAFTRPLSSRARTSAVRAWARFPSAAASCRSNRLAEACAVDSAVWEVARAASCWRW